MCVNCGKKCNNSCQKETVITKYGLPEKKTVLNMKDPSALTAITVKNTVFVQKNGVDNTGLVERFDKPFLTIGAAVTAALAAFTSRSSTNRILIKVESGLYNETIYLYNFIDFDLGNSVISNSNASRSSISSQNGTFTTVGIGEYNCIIYGNAQLLNTYSNLGIGLYTPNNIKLLINLASITCTSGEPLAIGNGANVLLHCNVLKSANAQNSAIIQAIQMFIDTGLEATEAATLEIHGCKISNTYASNQTGVITASFSNVLNSGKQHKLTLVSCEVINNSTGSSSINTYDDGSQFYGNLLLILKDTIIYNSGTGESIKVLGVGSAISLLTYNSYSNKAVGAGGAAPTATYGTLNVNASIIV